MQDVLLYMRCGAMRKCDSSQCDCLAEDCYGWTMMMNNQVKQNHQPYIHLLQVLKRNDDTVRCLPKLRDPTTPELACDNMPKTSAWILGSRDTAATLQYDWSDLPNIRLHHLMHSCGEWQRECWWRDMGARTRCSDYAGMVCGVTRWRGSYDSRATTQSGWCAGGGREPASRGCWCAY